MLAKGIKTVELVGAGGADTLTVNAAGLWAAGVTTVDADLSRVQGEPTTESNVLTVPMRDDGAVDRVTINGTDQGETITVSAVNDTAQQSQDVHVTVGSGFTVKLRATNGTTDGLTVDGIGGDDLFVVEGTAAAVPARVKLALLGGNGNDSATLPIGNLTFDGNEGSNAVTFLPASNGAVTVTSADVSTPTAKATYQNVNALTIGDSDVAARVSADVTVNSSPTGQSTVNLSGGVVTVNGTNGLLDVSLVGGTVIVNGNGGALDVALGDDGGAVTLNKTGTADISLALGIGGGTILVNETTSPLTVNLESVPSNKDATVTLVQTNANVVVTGSETGAGRS